MGCCGKKPVGESTDAYGEQKTGVAPASSRKCRDCFCCLLFLVFWAGMIVVAVVGIVNGDPKRLLYGVDYNGTTCGTGAMETKTLTFYPRMYDDLMNQMLLSGNAKTDPSKLSLYGVCVSECPAAYTYFCSYEAEAAIQADPKLTTDAEREAARKKKAEKLFGEKQCWFVAMPSQNVFYRCIQMTKSNTTSFETCVYPGDLPEYYDTVNGVKVPNQYCQVKQVRTISDATGPAQGNPIYDKVKTVASVIGRCIGDIQKTWDMVLIFGALVAFGLGFAFLIFLKYCAGCVIWIILWGFVAMLALFSVMVSAKAGILKDSDIQVITDSLQDAGVVAAAQNGLTIPEDLRASQDKQEVYKIVAYVFYGLTGLAFLLVCFFQKRVRITIGIIKEASRAIQKLPLLLIFPIWPFIMIVVLFIYSAIIGAFIYSTGKIKLDKIGAMVGAEVSVNGTDAALNATETALNTIEENNLMRILFAYHFFGFLWTNQLINAISMCTIAGAVCRYYWSREKTSSEMGRFPILYSFKNCFRYHFGSLAFGSFIIAVVQFIRAILMYIDHQTQDIQKSNLAVKVAMKVVQCCLWCFEKCLKFLSKNAYIMIAMKGKSFCSSAKDAFKAILFNIGQVGTVSMVTFLLLSAGKIAISMACGVIMFVFIESKPDLYGIGASKEISSPMAPIILTFLLSWFVASSFLGVYEMAIDTILMCYCEDKELNKDSGQYYMSNELKKFVASVPNAKPSGSVQEEPAV